MILYKYKATIQPPVESMGEKPVKGLFWSFLEEGRELDIKVIKHVAKKHDVPEYHVLKLKIRQVPVMM